MNTVILDTNAELQKGNYIVTYKVSLFGEVITWLLNQIQPVLNTVASLSEYKKLVIKEFIYEESDSTLKVHFNIIGDSPAVGLPVVLLVLAGLLASVMVFLTFDKLEKIIESPAGTALSFGSLFLIGFGIYFYLNNSK